MEQKPDIPSRHNVKNQRKIPKYFHVYQKGWHGKICNNPRSIKPNPLLPTLTPAGQVTKFQTTGHVFKGSMCLKNPALQEPAKNELLWQQTSAEISPSEVQDIIFQFSNKHVIHITPLPPNSTFKQ